jgi:hypothetical protein
MVKTISTKEELDEFEQTNIQQAIEWTLRTMLTEEQVLTEEFMLLVYKKIFGSYF